MSKPRHPVQPIVVDEHGVHRFKKNAIVEFLLDYSRERGCDMNRLAFMDFSQEDREQFAQLIGYDISGASELDYVSDRVFDEAMSQSKLIKKGK